MKQKLMLLIFLTLLAGISQVFAHGYVEKTEPEDGAELESSPEIIKVWFNEPLVAGSGEISMIRSSTGEAVALGETIHDKENDKLIYAEISETLPDGAYLVTTKATVQSDGHEPSSSFVFWVEMKNQQATGNDTNTIKPAYGVPVLLVILLAVAGVAGFRLMRRPAFEVVRPAQDVTHISLE